MQLNIRKLKESDWETLCSWSDEWPEWQNPPIALLINAAEEVCRSNGVKYMFSIGRNESLINIHEELGWNVDDKSSKELVKKI